MILTGNLEVTKHDKRNTATLKTFDDDFMSDNCNVIVFFPIYGQFAAIKITFSLTIIFYLIKTEKRTKKYLQRSSRTIALSNGIIFFPKYAVKGVLVLKGIFSEIAYVCVLTFQISSL